LLVGKNSPPHSAFTERHPCPAVGAVNVPVPAQFAGKHDMELGMPEHATEESETAVLPQEDGSIGNHTLRAEVR